MARRNLSREELFALVWEKPAREIGKELGVSDVAVAKLCRRLQVPKPPRGYWARVQAGRTPRRPALGAFREEIDRKRREAIRVRAVANLSPVHQQFYEAALSDLVARGIDVAAAQPRGGRLPDLDPDLAAQVLLLIQNRAKDWVDEGKVARQWRKLSLRAIMPIDFMPPREMPLPAAITRASAKPYDDRLRALLEIERAYDMLSRATYGMERDIPPETLALADRIWFGDERPFQTARQAWTRLQDELERWDRSLGLPPSTSNIGRL